MGDAPPPKRNAIIMGNQPISDADLAPGPPDAGQADAWAAAGSNPAPMSVAVALEQAHKLYVAGQLGKAERLCAQIVSQRPRMAAAHNLLAAIQHAQGNSAAAVKSMHRAISLDGENAQFYSNLGEMERQRGKLPQALLALRQAVRLDPSSTEALNNFGIVHYDRREFNEAVKCYGKLSLSTALMPRRTTTLATRCARWARTMRRSITISARCSSARTTPKPTTTWRQFCATPTRSQRPNSLIARRYLSTRATSRRMEIWHAACRAPASR